MPKRHNKNKKLTIQKVEEQEEEFVMSELHKEYEEQLLTQKEWDAYMENAGLNTLKNFEFLPQYKPSITYEMLLFDYQKPEDERWRKGQPYPLKGEIVRPQVIQDTEQK
jgi:hypothetical protein